MPHFNTAVSVFNSHDEILPFHSEYQVMPNLMPLAGVTVLLVEDSRYICDVIREMFNRLGARLRRAETIEQAGAHLRTYRPDVVIVDLGLPDGRGETLIHKICNKNNAPLIFGLSGDVDGREKALNAGASAFIDKPMPSFHVFQHMILRHLALKHGDYDIDDSEQIDEDAAPLCYDDLALQDDLKKALKLLLSSVNMGSTLKRYVVSFIAGIARAAKDHELLDAAQSVMSEEKTLDSLKLLISKRLKGRALI